MKENIVNEVMNFPYSPLIHIGFPKALSTKLQRHFFKPAYGFRTIIDPIRAQRLIINQNPFEFDDFPIRQHLLRLQGKKRNPRFNVPVITGENLVGEIIGGGYGASIIADRLQNCFPYSRILVVVREQHQALRSLYVDSLKVGGMSHSVRDLFSPPQVPSVVGFDSAFLRYDAIVDYYRELFGSPMVKVLPMELFDEDPTGFTRSIQKFAGLENAPPMEAKLARTPVNSSNRPFTLTALRAANRYLVYDGYNARGLFLQTPARQGKRRKLARTADRLVPKTRLDGLLDNRLRRRIRGAMAGKFAASNRRLAAMIDIDLSRYGYEM